jgi:excisionase family DNA binding protein
MLKPEVRTWGSIPEAATRCGVSTNTLRRFITQGLVYAERVGPKRIRVDLTSVDELGTPLAYSPPVA